MLERHSDEGVETFSLERRIAYADRHLGELLVPADPDFRTDLTSVPALFTWLVPKTGAHLPAALLHDALVAGPDDPVSYVSTDGHDVDRVEADRVFRDAMADTGTGVIRRWIVWTAVTVATIFVRPRPAVVAGPATGRYRIAAGVTIADRPLPRLQRHRRPRRPVVAGRRPAAVDGRPAVVGRGGRRAGGCHRGARSR